MVIPDLAEIHRTALNARTKLLDEAEKRNYDPPVSSEAIADLDWIIKVTETPDTPGAPT